VPFSLDDLTVDQLRVVTHAGGPLLVLGGAGTGKTRALLSRFTWLATAAQPAIAPEAILVLTFSAGAADALRAQLEDALGDRGFEELAVSTVPGFCARLLHDEAFEAGLDPFVAAATPADRLAMLLERVDELTLREHDFGGNAATLLSAVIARVDRLKDAMVSAAAYARWAEGLPDGDPRTEREREFAAIYEAHDRMLAEQGSLDFGDLVLHAHRLLRDRTDVRARLAGRFRHVLVDEYQELNVAQARLVALLGAEHGNLVVAGDDDQAI
jgi:DNA helicase-2/ATP-dependent DNA helicase PcrA